MSEQNLFINKSSELIRAENLCLFYNDSNQIVKAVDNVNLSIKSNGFYGIIGPSGAGKSSLLYLLAGFKKPTSGKLYFNNEQYPEDQDQRLQIGRKYIGYDFQRNFLISYLTVEENIFAGVEKINDQILQNYEYLMRMINIWHLKDRFPHSISAGERQRVSIARCLIKNPKIAFFDEPTSYLNLENGLKTSDILHNLSTHMAVVVVTHDNKILRKEDNIFQILDGKLISSS